MERLTVWQAEVSASRVGEGKVDCRDLPGEVQQRIMHGTRKSRISSIPHVDFRPVPGSRSNTGRAASSFGSRSAVSSAGACLRCGRLVFNFVRIRGQAYQEPDLHTYELKYKNQILSSLRRRANGFGFNLVGTSEGTLELFRARGAACDCE